MLRNAGATPLEGDVWTVAERPLGTVIYTSAPIASGSLAPGDSLKGTFTQAVPANAEAGYYFYSVRVGNHPNGVAASHTLRVGLINPTPGQRGAGPDAWSVTAATPWGDAALNAEPTGGSVAARASTPAGAAAYPNPFREQTQLSFSLDAPAAVRLVVYDALGREVARLADGRLDAGHHAVAFDGSGLPSGLYLWRLDAGGAVQTGRLTLLR